MDYALYKGDEFLIVGELEELADYLGVSVGTIKHYATPSHIKRYKKSYIVIKLEDEGEYTNEEYRKTS